MKATTLGLALVLALATAVNSHDTAVGTGTIHGRVVDKESSKPLAYANVTLVGTSMGAMSLADGTFTLVGVPAGTYTVRAMMMGFKDADSTRVVVRAGESCRVDFKMEAMIVAETKAIEVRAERAMVEVTESKLTASVDETQLQSMPVKDVLDAVGLKAGTVRTGDDMHVRGGRTNPVNIQIELPPDAWRYAPPVDREQYEHLAENDFLKAIENPLSTFSIDVDVASYANMRRFVTAGRVPPGAAVRIEEFINYFDYDYPQPNGRDPFAIVTETARCPWNPENRLVHIGLQGREMERAKAPPSNLVFLIDVSGSMSSPDKLQLIKDSLPMLVAQLRRTDSVALVVYAGSAGVVLESTPGDEKNTILEAIRRLESGGSTAGGAGIRLAYDIAQKNFIKKGNNRVILATDGDFNVGVSSDGELVELIEAKRKTGVFLTVLGVGTGNLQDAKMEKIADHGNGNYAYLDNLAEAQKVLVNEMFGTIVTIAKDVKIQVEFNPLKVASYRLIGYENRMLKKEDFRDDLKDAGELGAGHTVTALYEITPANGSERGEELTFTRTEVKGDARSRDELLIVRLRYKQPDGDKSTEIVHPADDTDTAFDKSSQNFRFAAAVAEFGMILRGSNHAGSASLDHVIKAGRNAAGEDLNGYRAEFVELAERCRELQPAVSSDD